MSSPAMLLFNRPIRALLPQLGRKPINVNNNEEYNEALKARQEEYIKNNDAHKDSIFCCAGSIVVVLREDGDPWTHTVIIEGNGEEHQG